MVKALATIDDLTPDTRNANKGTVRGRAMIEQSIRECGAGRSIVVDREGRVIGGNKTLEVVEELGLPVVVVPSDGKTLVVVQRTDLDLATDPKARRLAYLDNRTTDVDLEWDAEAIAADLEAGVELGDLFDKGELDEIMASIEPDPGEAPEAQIDKADELQQKWGTARGQLWEIGKHRLLCGDSTVAEDVQGLMGGEKAALVFSDPPYGVSIVGKNGKIGASNLAANHSYAPVANDNTTDVARAIYQMMVGTPMILWGGNYFTEFLPASPCWLIWDKREGMTSNNFADCEMAWTSFDGPARIYRHLWSGMIRKGTDGDKLHPTQKPVDLHTAILRDFSAGAALVYDPCLGSGTTMVSAEQLGRRCYGIEIAEKYVAVTLERMAAMGLEPRLCES